MIAGIYFTCVFFYLIIYIVPNIEWRGWVDVLAVGAYLCGVVPLLSITLLEFGVIGKNFDEKKRIRTHFLLLIGFLVVSHVAMVFGMVDPSITDEHGHHEIHHNEHMQSHEHHNHSHME